MLLGQDKDNLIADGNIKKNRPNIKTKKTVISHGTGKLMHSQSPNISEVSCPDYVLSQPLAYTGLLDGEAI